MSWIRSRFIIAALIVAASSISMAAEDLSCNGVMGGKPVTYNISEQPGDLVRASPEQRRSRYIEGIIAFLTINPISIVRDGNFLVRDRIRLGLAELSRRMSRSDFESLEDLLKELRSEESKLPANMPKGEMVNNRTVKNWAPANVQVPQKYGVAYGSAVIKIPIEQLRQHFRDTLPEGLGEVAVNSTNAVRDFEKVKEWIQLVETDVVQEMWQAGYRKVKYYKNPVLREYYLDRVLARRASVRGMTVKSNGQPFNMLTFDIFSFYRTLAKGGLFVDWTGINAVGGRRGDWHYARGHELQMTYLAEHVPNFVNLIKYVGESHDAEGVWTYLFDNPTMKTAFWTGTWGKLFGPFLGIRY